MVDIVKQGKALYLGISRWPLEALKFADQYLKERDCPLLIFQDRLNMLDHALAAMDLSWARVLAA